MTKEKDHEMHVIALRQRLQSLDVTNDDDEDRSEGEKKVAKLLSLIGTMKSNPYMQYNWYSGGYALMEKGTYHCIGNFYGRLNGQSEDNLENAKLYYEKTRDLSKILGAKMTVMEMEM